MNYKQYKEKTFNLRHGKTRQRTNGRRTVFLTLAAWQNYIEYNQD